MTGEEISCFILDEHGGREQAQSSHIDNAPALHIAVDGGVAARPGPVVAERRMNRERASSGEIGSAGEHGSPAAVSAEKLSMPHLMNETHVAANDGSSGGCTAESGGVAGIRSGRGGEYVVVVMCKLRLDAKI